MAAAEQRKRRFGGTEQPHALLQRRGHARGARMRLRRVPVPALTMMPASRPNGGSAAPLALGDLAL